MKRILLLPLLYITTTASAQTYTDTIQHHRLAYRNEFVTNDHSPLGTQDTAYLRFFPPNPQYRLTATLKLTPEATKFQMSTHSGKAKTYRKYAILTFTLLGKTHKLEIYQSPDLLKNPKHKNHLFLPFTDLTNYEQTYGGGRYIDLDLTHIANNTITLDFNKAYNPYCAYATGYNCPIPPDANRLPIPIPAGEKTFAKTLPE